MRVLVELTGRFHGFVHSLLSDAGVVLRSRGGAYRGRG
ncbi:MAG: helix-turn-helix domain-containing protein [Pseudonocardiaceae bacterium]